MKTKETKDKVNLTSIIVIRPIEDGGSKRERKDCTDINTRRCLWQWQGRYESILIQDGMELKPLLRSDKSAVTASAAYDANNPNALHSCWKPKATGLQKIAIGVLALVAVGMFILAFVWIKGGTGV